VLDGYFKANRGVEYVLRLGVEPQSPNPQPVVIGMNYNDPIIVSLYNLQLLLKVIQGYRRVLEYLFAPYPGENINSPEIDFKFLILNL